MYVVGLAQGSSSLTFEGSEGKRGANQRECGVGEKSHESSYIHTQPNLAFRQSEQIRTICLHMI